MKAETPFAPGVSGSVRAKSRTVPAKLPFVIHCFVPEMDQPSPAATAAVLSEPASEPAESADERAPAEETGSRRA